MTQWLRRSALPEASKHTVDRLMRAGTGLPVALRGVGKGLRDRGFPCVDRQSV
jgi:hypothetical protein